MNWYKNSQNKINLLDIYDEYELNDSSEAISEFISPSDLNRQFSIKILTPGELKQLKTYMGETTVYETYLQFATDEQKRIVQQKMKNYDNNRIVIIANQTLLDGYHQVIASILLNKSQKCIDIYEEEKYASIKIAKRDPLDIYARDITNKIIEQIKEENFIGRIREGLPENVYSLEWRLRNSDLKNKVAVTGGFYPDTQEIELNIWTPSDTTVVPKKLYESLYYDLFQAIRHEIEHAKQTEQEQKSPGRYQDLTSDVNKYIFNSIENLANYLLAKHETEAYVRGFVALAKKLNKPVEEIMRERLWLGFERFLTKKYLEEYAYFNEVQNIDNIYNEIKNKIETKINEIINKWMAYAKSIYPNIQASKAINKKAFPITDQPNMHGYMGIGHRGKPENNILWFIDGNYNLHSISELQLAEQTRTETKNQHDYWEEYLRYSRKNRVYAKGRYDINQNKASINILRYVIMQGSPNYGIAEKRVDYATKKITSILDKAFNNPSIQTF